MKLRLKNLKYSLRSLNILIKRHPIYLLCSIVSMICIVINSLIPINVVNKIVTMFQQNKTFKEITIVILINVSITIITYIINESVSVIKLYISSHFTLSFSTTLFKKMSNIDYEFHQNHQFLDNYTRALDAGAENIYGVANNQMELIKEIIRSVFLFTIIFSASYIAVIYALVIAIIYMLLKRTSAELQFKRANDQRPFQRMEWGISRMYFVKDAIPDIKTTAINDVMLDEYEMVNEKRLKIYQKTTSKKAIVDAIGNALMVTIFPVIMLCACISTIDALDLALISSLSVAATTISNTIYNFTNIITSIQIHSLEAKITFEVLDMDSKIEGKGGQEPDKKFLKLDIKDAEFAYTDRNIIDNISLSIKAGEKVAIVGTNGAGKTTLVKLLLRLYDVKEGKIDYNAVNYKKLDPIKLRKKIGAVFQNPEVYSVSIAENILLKKIETPEEEQKVIEALKFADIYDYVSTLPEGINTIVTREFDREGAIFSGGQMQKIAVARGYAQNYDILLLDEPSSRLDPIAESKMYKRMLQMGEGKTLIFISHRLSATINCDHIYLFEKGKIIEQGTHEELMRIPNGKYREMFESQSEKYIGDNHA